MAKTPEEKKQSVVLNEELIGSRKIFVLDTNVLIHNPESLFNFQNNVVVIPIVVIEEIDNFKKGLDEKGRNARQIGRYLDKLRSDGSLKDGIPINVKEDKKVSKDEKNGYLIVEMSHKIQESMNKYYFKNENDNLIIGTALYFKEKFPNKKVILISKDANVRIKANAVNIDAENYENETVKFEELYTGVLDLHVKNDDYEQYKDKKFLLFQSEDIYPNQFIRIHNKEHQELPHLLGRYSSINGSIYPLSNYTSLDQKVFTVNALNEEQQFAFDLLLDENIKLVSLIGKAGTGKTLIAIAAGLHQVVEANKYSRLVISRPISPLGKDIGFLPGSKADKFNPWMQPIYDNMEILLSQHVDKQNQNNGKIFGKKTPQLQDYLDFGFIELEPLTYIRGRSLPNQFIIIDEAQNLTPHEMKTIITRAGKNTKIVLTGDPYQIDIPYLDSESNGLSMSAEKMKTEVLVGHITLEKGERSQLADLAAKYF